MIIIKFIITAVDFITFVVIIIILHSIDFATIMYNLIIKFILTLVVKY